MTIGNNNNNHSSFANGSTTTTAKDDIAPNPHSIQYLVREIQSKPYQKIDISNWYPDMYRIQWCEDFEFQKHFLNRLEQCFVRWKDLFIRFFENKSSNNNSNHDAVVLQPDQFEPTSVFAVKRLLFYMEILWNKISGIIGSVRNVVNFKHADTKYRSQAVIHCMFYFILSIYDTNNPSRTLGQMYDLFQKYFKQMNKLWHGSEQDANTYVDKSKLFTAEKLDSIMEQNDAELKMTNQVMSWTQ